MKTRKQCFEEARQLFIDSNPELVSHIEQEATVHAKALGITYQEFVMEEISKMFVRHLKSLGGDITVRVIKMMAPDEATKKALILEYHYEEADALGIPREVYLRESGVEL